MDLALDAFMTEQEVRIRGELRRATRSELWRRDQRAARRHDNARVFDALETRGSTKHANLRGTRIPLVLDGGTH